MLVHYKQIVRRFNALRTKKRYKEKRIRRAFLTEAFIDGEIELYKPAHVPYKIYTDRPTARETMALSEEVLKKDWKTPEEDRAWKYLNEKPVKFNWFEKFLLWIKEVFK